MIEPATGRDAKIQYRFGRMKDLKEQTVLHTGVYDIEALDSIRKAMHEYFIQSYENPQALVKCNEAAMQMTMIFENYMRSDRNRDNLWDRLEGFAVEIRTEFAKMTDGKGRFTPFIEPHYSRYVKLRGDMLLLMRRVYQAKHSVGLRIPSARVWNDLEKMDNAMQRPHDADERTDTPVW